MEAREVTDPAFLDPGDVLAPPRPVGRALGISHK
jgi:hypothetical protein